MENNRWIPVKERLPETDEKLLVWENKFGTSQPLGNGRCDFAYFERGKWLDIKLRDYENNPDYMIVTHWMPLPDGP